MIIYISVGPKFHAEHILFKILTNQNLNNVSGAIALQNELFEFLSWEDPCDHAKFWGLNLIDIVG